MQTKYRQRDTQHADIGTHRHASQWHTFIQYHARGQMSKKDRRAKEHKDGAWTDRQ